MKFSGHETFPIREGWLHKGLKLVEEDPELWLADRVEDWLGVGRNMGKAIRHWLEVTGLAAFARGEAPEATSLGELVWERDPYFAEIGTWWGLHAQVVNAPEEATSWAWFFNRYAQSRFTKVDCLVALRQHLELHALNRTPPSPRTLERDLGCLLASYARPFPPEPTDPEDAGDCPLRELGLLRHFLESGTYQVDYHAKPIPPEVFAYVLTLAERDEGAVDAGFLEVPLHRAAGGDGGPGRVFCLTAERLFEEAVRVEDRLQGDFEIGGLAGERILRVRNLHPHDWLGRYYDARENRHAA